MIALRRAVASPLHRARLGFLAACALTVALLATQLPIGELVSQRQQLAVASEQLATLSARNAALRSENASLLEPSTVEAIAHAEYGLVRPGQRAFVILPASSEPGSATIRQSVLPRSALVAGTASALTGLAASGAPPAPGPGLFDRTLQHLEFWRWAF